MLGQFKMLLAILVSMVIFSGCSLEEWLKFLESSGIDTTQPVEPTPIEPTIIQHGQASFTAVSSGLDANNGQLLATFDVKATYEPVKLKSLTIKIESTADPLWAIDDPDIRFGFRQYANSQYYTWAGYPWDLGDGVVVIEQINVVVDDTTPLRFMVDIQNAVRPLPDDAIMTITTADFEGVSSGDVLLDSDIHGLPLDF